MSHNCDMILFNFYRNWLIHKVLVSDFEGSNPSLTAKLKKTDLRVGFLLSGKYLCRQVSQSHAVADHPRTHPPGLQSTDGTSLLFVLPAPAP